MQISRERSSAKTKQHLRLKFEQKAHINTVWDNPPQGGGGAPKVEGAHRLWDFLRARGML